MPDRTETTATVRGRVVLIRSRVAGVRVTNDGGSEFDVDVPLLFLPEGVARGAELEIEFRVRDKK